MDTGLESLGELVFLRSYSRSGENWNATVERYLQFWRDRFPTMLRSINGYGEYIHSKKVVGSMRMMQFAGKPVEENHCRAYNCSALAVQDFQDFGDIMYLLACGCGVGVSVQKHYTKNLPEIPDGHVELFIIPDSKEGWADSIVALLMNPDIDFDYSLIRPEGAPLVSSGGFASGSRPLKFAHERIREIISSHKKLLPIDVADIVCHVARAIVSGGQRRSAIIVLFDQGDTDMRTFKSGQWFDNNPQRGIANVSEVAVKNSVDIGGLVEAMLSSPSGEPGIVLVSSINYEENLLGNPCLEVSLRSRSFCNLCEVIVPNCTDKYDFAVACQAASFFGTLQASLTDFPYINPEWSVIAKEESLIGVSLTGVAQAPEWFTSDVVREGALEVVAVNANTSRRIGINQAKRCTVGKPSGSVSCVMGTTSGIGAAHFEYGVRRVRVTKSSSLGKALMAKYGCPESVMVPGEMGEFFIPTDRYAFVVNDCYSDKDLCLQFPCHYSDAIYAHDEGAVEFLSRLAKLYHDWIVPGHRLGQETNNISVTVHFREEEKEAVKEWMLSNQDSYRGITVLPLDQKSYPLSPFESLSKEEYDKFVARFPNPDWSEFGLEAKVQHTAACAGGSSCEVGSV